MSSTIRFNISTNTTNPSNSGTPSGFLVLPKNVATKILKNTKIGPEEKVAVEGVINSLPFQSTLELDKSGNILLKINNTVHLVSKKSTQVKGVTIIQATKDAQHVAPTVQAEFMRIGDEEETRVPTDFQKALKEHPKVKALWVDITPLARRDWIYWITTAKQEETREKRVRVACSKMNSGMRRVCCFPGVNWLMKNGK